MVTIKISNLLKRYMQSTGEHARIGTSTQTRIGDVHTNTNKHEHTNTKTHTNRHEHTNTKTHTNRHKHTNTKTHTNRHEHTNTNRRCAPQDSPLQGTIDGRRLC